MPEADYLWLPREDILQFEEIDRLVDQFLNLGVDKVRLTGGEPLLRRDLVDLVARLGKKPGIKDFAMTTNAVLLAPSAADLKAAGLHRLTISLDTLQRDRFIALARFLIWERSFWQTTTMPEGKCVMRTAESVVLTCWPPAPEAR